jgi:hypothetical protein
VIDLNAYLTFHQSRFHTYLACVLYHVCAVQLIGLQPEGAGSVPVYKSGHALLKACCNRVPAARLTVEP